jgi:hypothetical protein
MASQIQQISYDNAGACLARNVGSQSFDQLFMNFVCLTWRLFQGRPRHLPVCNKLGKVGKISIVRRLLVRLWPYLEARKADFCEILEGEPGLNTPVLLARGLQKAETSVFPRVLNWLPKKAKIELSVPVEKVGARLKRITVTRPVLCDLASNSALVRQLT